MRFDLLQICLSSLQGHIHIFSGRSRGLGGGGGGGGGGGTARPCLVWGRRVHVSNLQTALLGLAVANRLMQYIPAKEANKGMWTHRTTWHLCKHDMPKWKCSLGYSSIKKQPPHCCQLELTLKFG